MIENAFDYVTEHSDHPKEECGVVGIFAPDDHVARMAYFSLFALQHRGQEAAGIAVSDGKRINIHKGVGLVSQVFNPDNLNQLYGDYCIGHTRYSTTGSSTAHNAQPYLIETFYGPIAVAHNGNLVNAEEIRKELLQHGVGFSSTSDTEVITMLLAGAQGDTWEERIHEVMPKLRGAYSMVILTLDGVFAIRDPWGFRPLSVGLLPSGGHAVASESGALHTIGCTAVREVHPGEIISLSNSALKVFQSVAPKENLALCTFEHIYFSRPDSIWDGLLVHQVRTRLGEELYRQKPIDADVVIPVPDSSIPAAIGYSKISGIPYNVGFIKNRYIGRTFIEPTDSLRKQGIKLKFNVIEQNVCDKRVVMIDDSIVRGNTTGALVKLVREAGAKEIHLRITCPPIAHPCYMGVDMGTYKELIAHNMTIDQIREHTGSDSLEFLTVENMMQAIGKKSGYCNACFTGQYPLDVNHVHIKAGFELQHTV
ncbi:MAG: amidophosphoribosyltransferase [Anaerolineaceae bacterium]|nr:amidophosphoribosyltransferase [Anaerolineaceae bacterium]